jgi:hypothetical protein
MWEVPFWNLAAQAGHRHLHRRHTATEHEQPPEEVITALRGRLAFSDNSPGNRRLFTFKLPAATVLLSIWGRRADVLVLAATPDEARRVGEVLDAALSAGEHDDGMVTVSYWCNSRGGPQHRSRRLDMPGWPEVRANYPADVRATLDGLATATEPAEGRLLLWHGPPGTGKTSAVRALARAWRKWASLHFVVDPEEFFGHGASYMTEVLMAEPDRPHTTQLLVLEDAGELIAPDARAGTGQGLSRLLNLADGVLGQGLDSLILITTNEPLSQLHPAVSRPGRCWAEVEFPPLARDEANRWLAEHGHEELAVRAATPLAELFALTRGETPRPDRAIGFAAAL